MRKLVLGAAPSDYNKNIHIALGTWCFVGQEHLPDWEEGEISPDPLVTEEDWLALEVEVDQLLTKYSPFVTSYLNQKNEINKCQEYWRVLGQHWLSSLFLNFCLRKKIIEKCIEKYSKEEIEVELVEAIGEFNFYSSNDFVYEGINGNPFNHWMFSEILKNKLPSSWKAVKYTKKAQDISGKFEPKAYHWKLKILLSLEGLSRFRRVYGVSLFKQYLLSFPLLLKKAPSIQLTYVEKNLNFPHDEFFNWEEVIIKTVPRSLLNIKKVDSNFIFYKKGILVLCGTLLYSNEDWKIKLANFIENGGHYFTVQHGCNYGVAKVHASLKYIESWRNSFISWGWVNAEKYELKAIPISSPLLATLNKSYSHYQKNLSRSSIIYVGRDPNPFVYNLYPCTQPNQLIEYRRKKINFLSLLDKKIFQHVKYRPAPHNKASLRDYDYLIEKLPNLKICEGQLHPELYKSKLVICDSPGTTYHICMAGNIPVIGVWPSSEYLFVSQTRDLFENLKSVGVIFETPEKAAEKVNQVYDEIEKWWSSPDIQKAREKWNERNARHNPKWLMEWFRLMKKI